MQDGITRDNVQTGAIHSARKSGNNSPHSENFFDDNVARRIAARFAKNAHIVWRTNARENHV